MFSLSPPRGEGWGEGCPPSLSQGSWGGGFPQTQFAPETPEPLGQRAFPLVIPWDLGFGHWSFPRPRPFPWRKGSWGGGFLHTPHPRQSAPTRRQSPKGALHTSLGQSDQRERTPQVSHPKKIKEPCRGATTANQTAPVFLSPPRARWAANAPSGRPSISPTFPRWDCALTRIPDSSGRGRPAAARFFNYAIFGGKGLGSRPKC